MDLGQSSVDQGKAELLFVEKAALLPGRFLWGNTSDGSQEL